MSARVRRGLRHLLITPKQVHLGQWESDVVLHKRKRDEQIARENKRKAEKASLEERLAAASPKEKVVIYSGKKKKPRR